MVTDDFVCHHSFPQNVIVETLTMTKDGGSRMVSIAEELKTP
ncbi:hypothetical protein [Prevotella sp. P2-180]|nr:hypothetical protein [Prevotella sp. P2-180]